MIRKQRWMDIVDSRKKVTSAYNGLSTEETMILKGQFNL